MLFGINTFHPGDLWWQENKTIDQLLARPGVQV